MKIQEEIAGKYTLQQKVQSDMRKALRLSKQCIFKIHIGLFSEADELLSKARVILRNLRFISEQHQEILCLGIVKSAYEEYAEASILFGLVTRDLFVGFDEIEVPAISYVLGLADVIGELRRSALDFIRVGKNEKAERNLHLMEEIYSDLMNLSEIQFMVSNLRRKMDIARRIIEATRGDITSEVRRKSLEESIRTLESRLERTENTKD